MGDEMKELGHWEEGMGSSDKKERVSKGLGKRPLRTDQTTRSGSTKKKTEGKGYLK